MKGLNKMKKIFAILISICLLASLFAGCAGGGSDNGGSVDTVTVSPVTAAADTFADGDYKDVSTETANAEITLSGSSATAAGSRRA